MLKAVGILCIISGCTGWGLMKAAELEMRVRELDVLRHLMLRLKSELSYLHRSLPDAFLALSENAREPFREFFRRMGEGLLEREGSTADEIWQGNADALLTLLHFTKADERELRRLGSLLGGMDLELQVNLLDNYLQYLELAGQRAGETVRTHERLYRYLGALGGIFLAVLVL